MHERLWPFIGGIARENGMKPIEVGGVDDHVHILLSLPATMPISKAMQLIKAGSSKFVNESLSRARFEWQKGYGAFAIGTSAIPATVAYIRNQEEHHRTRTFQEEFISFLEKNGIEYDPRYVWG